MTGHVEADVVREVEDITFLVAVEEGGWSRCDFAVEFECGGYGYGEGGFSESSVVRDVDSVSKECPVFDCCSFIRTGEAQTTFDLEVEPTN